MKITVVTVHDSANFGSYLQAYAMKYFLEQRGHEVSFAVTRDKKYVKSLFYSLRPTKWWIRYPFKTLKSIAGGIKKYRVFKKELAVFAELDTASDADAVILGSDEIWNVKTPVFTSPLFYGENCKNPIAYAVSAGHSLSDDIKKYPHLCSLIQKLPSPLVRDDNTADCVEEICGTRPSVVCDPTFLVEKDCFAREYHNSFLEKYPCLVVYTYELEPDIVRVIKTFAKKHGLKLVSVGFQRNWCDKSILCSPLDFCGVMEKAKYVITTTFHGSIFSVLNHKQFVSLPYSLKTTDVLERVGLEHRIVKYEDLSVEALEDKMFSNNIDYTLVDEKIRAMREFSAKMLEERINEYENM